LESKNKVARGWVALDFSEIIELKLGKKIPYIVLQLTAFLELFTSVLVKSGRYFPHRCAAWEVSSTIHLHFE